MTVAAFATAVALAVVPPAQPPATPTPPAVDPSAALAITPSTGDTVSTSTVGFTAPRACSSDAQWFLVQASGAGLAPDTNLLGVTEFPIGDDLLFPNGIVTNYPMGNTFNNAVGQQNAVLPLSGTMSVNFICIRPDQTASDIFATTIVFTPSTGANSTYVAAPTVTPSPPPPAINGLGYVFRMPDTCANITAGMDCGALVLSVPSVPSTAFDVRLADSWVEGVAPIAPVIVRDTRPGELSWSVVGQASDFSGPNGVSKPAKWAGWRPAVLSPGTGAKAGPDVEPGLPNGEGLSVPRVLGVAGPGKNGRPSSSTTTFGGLLITRMPTDTPAGEYHMTLTLTLMA